MGYTTEFSGKIEISPPLNQEEINFINAFSQTRHMTREENEYFIDTNGDGKVIDYNTPPKGVPGLWCQWVVTEDGKFIEWDGNEKFYNAVKWMEYIIDHFIASCAIAKEHLPFLQANHTCNGKIFAQGEEIDDRWTLVVRNNVVVYEDATEIDDSVFKTLENVKEKLSFCEMQKRNGGIGYDAAIDLYSNIIETIEYLIEKVKGDEE